MQAQSDLASHVSEALHSTEGASPVSLEDILDGEMRETGIRHCWIAPNVQTEIQVHTHLHGISIGFPLCSSSENLHLRGNFQGHFVYYCSFGSTSHHSLTDQGSNFMSITLSLLKERYNIGSIRTSPYHPQSNGRLERFHSTLKSMLSKCISHKHDWPIVLDLALYFARNVPSSRHGFTPHELLFLKPSPFILSTLKSLWTSSSLPSVNLPQFISDLDDMLACQTHHLKESLSTKCAQKRLSRESNWQPILK